MVIDASLYCGISEQSLGGFRTWNLPRTLRIIVLGAVHSCAHWILLHQPCIEWLKTVGNVRRFRDTRIQPQIVVCCSQDRRHSIMHIGYQRVWLRSKYRAGFNDVASRISPAFPEAREGKNRIIDHAKVVRLLLLRSDPLPFVEGVRRDQATSPPHGITESGFLCGGLRHRINGFESDRRVFGPIRNKPPTEQGKGPLRFFLVLADNGHRLRRCNVPTRHPRRVFVETKVVTEVTLFRRETVTPTHWTFSLAKDRDFRYIFAYDCSRNDRRSSSAAPRLGGQVQEVRLHRHLPGC